MSRTVDNRINTRPYEKPDGSSSYFDFVEKKTQEKCIETKDDAMDLTKTGRDAFVVKVMDEETASELKLKYFP